MMPLGAMSRDELAQLLLCYIGTAADILEFFDSFKVSWEMMLILEDCVLQDDKVNTDKVLCLCVLCIWNWSLLQFTIVISSSKVVIFI